MANRRKQSGADIDWYLISIDRLKQIGLVVVLLLLGGAGWWFWHNQKGNPKSNAESAIADARAALNQLAASPEFNQRRNEFNRAQQRLDQANAFLAATRFDEARDAAVESQTISRAALSGGADLESDARFITVEGEVTYQKGAAGEWKDADPRVPLVNGDWVKTGARASAELIFANGALYTVGPNALLEIYSVIAPGQTKRTNAVQMRVGTVEVATPSNNVSAVRTPGTQVVVESESVTQVGVADEKTDVVATRGATQVTPEKGGPTVRLASGEKITATPEGSISPVKKLSMAPALLAPGDNQVFQLSPNLKVELTWDAREGASGYVLQVSRSRLFSTQEINTKRTARSAVARVTSEGAFYWRVASVGPDGDVGPFSTFRRFRVTGGGTNTGTTDRSAPKLTMKAPFHVGGQYYTIAGTTEPGATVFINDEEVDVESSGTFQKLIALAKLGPNTVVIKASDAAGNQTVQSQTVIVEE
jgi:hypothetical protein